jgi:hypothetical protein
MVGNDRPYVQSLGPMCLGHNRGFSCHNRPTIIGFLEQDLDDPFERSFHLNEEGVPLVSREAQA